MNTYRRNRELALMRDEFTCVKCGSRKRVEVHHKLKVRLGGGDELTNLVTLCAHCHHLIEKGKTNEGS